MKKLIISLATIILSLPAIADEGMWLLPLIKGQRFQQMQELGLKLQHYDIYNPDSSSLKDAVVIFGGGCTGEIISPDGLLLTNHHCGYGCIQRHSSLEHDYLTDGFWAMSREEELLNPGMTVTFIDKIDDVTDYVKAELAKETDPNSMNFLSPKYLNALAKAKRSMSKSEYNLLLQDYVCSVCIRVARDMFALLPIRNTIVHTVLDGKTILSVNFDRQNLSKVKFGYIDPSDTLKQFKYNMDFNETNGFTPVSNLE